jgi:hypothetical protein
VEQLGLAGLPNGAPVPAGELGGGLDRVTTSGVQQDERIFDR